MRLKIFHQGVFAFLSFATFALFHLSSCRETQTLDLSGGVDTTNVAQQKNIILEDLTGVRCVNCPEAHEIAAQIADDNEGRVELVSVHTGFFAVPYPFSNQDFETTAGNQIETYLGGPVSYPLAGIDRAPLSGQTNLLHDKSVWNGLVAQRLADTLHVELELSNDYNAATRALSIDLSATYLNNINDAQKITVIITESNIVDPQLDVDGVDTFYVHNNVLRHVLSDATGDAITETTTSGTELQRNYTFTLPNNWIAENCRVIAFIAKETADSKQVLQVIGKNVQ